MSWILCTVKGQMLVRRRRTEREDAAVGLRTSSCLVLEEEVAKTVYHHYSALILPLLLCFLWKPSPQIQGIGRAIQSIGFERR